MKLRVGHLDVAVNPMDTTQARGDALDGVYYPLTQEIRVASALTDAEKRRVLLHEVIHAAWHAYKLPEEVTEEEACGRLDRALVQVLNDNPKLVAVLRGERRLF